MNFVILDLEWNGSYSKRDKKFYNEIIEFGAVKTDSKLNIIDTFSMLVTPTIGKKLNSRIKALTNITNEELKDAHNTFADVSEKFGEFLGDAVLLTWGNSDIHALMENYGYYFGDDRPPYLTKYCDLQIYCEFALGVHDKGKQLGLSTCADLLNIDRNDLVLHRALTDAELSLLCFKKCCDEEKIKKYISNCDLEFYKKMTFRTTFITDIENPLIDKSLWTFTCPECHTAVKQVSDWVVKNRSFRAKFVCEKCNKEFIARVICKLRYEGVTVNKKLTIPRPTETKENDNNNEEKQEKE